MKKPKLKNAPVTYTRIYNFKSFLSFLRESCKNNIDLEFASLNDEGKPITIEDIDGNAVEWVTEEMMPDKMFTPDALIRIAVRKPLSAMDKAWEDLPCPSEDYWLRSLNGKEIRYKDFESIWNMASR